ncbi:hypothetical protein DPMN_015987 [Dreissena polymorpha]|uniref:Uncharacterized protein n=1 Tax=Dreissena polymorpha TaxID=45954 RepID=A0A9D4N8U6_DREPO|nr:hypothetical protein DPMN_015987 [Dreissena polymorpha]
MSSTVCCFVLHNSLLVILSGQRILRIYPEASFDEDLDFLYGNDSCSPGVCSRDEYWLHYSNEESDFGVDTNCIGSSDVLQLMEGFLCFTIASASILGCGREERDHWQSQVCPNRFLGFQWIMFSF